jgi:glutamate formiminotransferase/formiminotetrahydrofolate cyclodeaminase
MSFSTLSLNEVLDAFASPDPTPGGGSAAALAGALAASLLGMVANMPKTRTNTPEERRALDDVTRSLSGLRQTLTDLIDRDTAAYDLVVAAFKKPKATDEEKAARKTAIQDATRVATETPLETMRACAELLGLAKIVAEHGNRNAASDIGVGAALAMAGLTGGRLNVEINLAGLADAAYAARVRDEILLMMVGAGADLAATNRAAGLTRGPDPQ